MIWKVLVTILALDFLYRAIKYGRWEVQQFRSLLRKKEVDRRSWTYPYSGQDHMSDEAVAKYREMYGVEQLEPKTTLTTDLFPVQPHVDYLALSALETKEAPTKKKKEKKQ